MTTLPKISVIIPVYNVEKYLRQCLNSVVNQTMRDIQIICVNDGSMDNSRTILHEYGNRDARIKIIDKPNGGLSAARNAAYPYIQGKYTLFVDSDDWIEPDLCEKTYKESEATNAQITIFFDHRKSRQKFRLSFSDDKTTIQEKSSLLDFPVIWNKLWRTDFLLGNNLYFPEGLVFEDNLVNWKAVVLAERFSVVPEQFYHHRRTPGSITRKAGEHWLDLIPIYNKIGEYLVESGHYADYRDKFIPMKLDVWYRHYRNLPSSMQSEYTALVRDSLTADDREFYRTAPKKQLRKIARLFYAMLDGGKADAWKFRIAYTLNQMMRMPELLVRQWIVGPLQTWNANRDCQ